MAGGSVTFGAGFAAGVRVAVGTGALGVRALAGGIGAGAIRAADLGGIAVLDSVRLAVAFDAGFGAGRWAAFFAGACGAACTGSTRG